MSLYGLCYAQAQDSQVSAWYFIILQKEVDSLSVKYPGCLNCSMKEKKTSNAKKSKKIHPVGEGKILVQLSQSIDGEMRFFLPSR